MSSSTTAPVRPEHTSAASWVARVLLGLLGIVFVGATTYLSFFASMEEGRVSGAVDWLVAAWSMTIAIGYLFVAVRLGDGTRHTLWLARGLVIAHLVFGLVKLVGYGETEGIIFMVLDLLILGLLAVTPRSR